MVLIFQSSLKQSSDLAQTLQVCPCAWGALILRSGHWRGGLGSTKGTSPTGPSLRQNQNQLSELSWR